MEELNKNIRNGVLNHLRLLASENLQLKYQEEVPYCSVPNELMNIWDDYYWPDSESFIASFDNWELLLLEKMNETILEVSENSSNDLPELTQFVETLEWKKINKTAQDILRDIENY